MADYGLVLVTAPAVEPVSLAEAKTHCRVETAFTADDDYLKGLIAAARQRVEKELNRSFITTAWRLDLNGFPHGAGYGAWHGHAQYASQPPPYGGAIELPISPVQLLDGNGDPLTSITYVDISGVTHTLAADTYQISQGQQGPTCILPAYLKFWPPYRPQYGAVKVSFTAGYGSAGSDVPAPIRQAMLLLAGHWYERRELIVVGRNGPMPLSVEWLLAPYWDGRY